VLIIGFIKIHVLIISLTLFYKNKQELQVWILKNGHNNAGLTSPNEDIE
jgi:hypothetical protein